MRFIEAEIEKPCKVSYKKLKDEFAVFMRMNVKTAKVLYTKEEYSCITSARVSLCDHIRENDLPIKVTRRNGNLYLTRTDL